MKNHITLLLLLFVHALYGETYTEDDYFTQEVFKQGTLGDKSFRHVKTGELVNGHELIKYNIVPLEKIGHDHVYRMSRFNNYGEAYFTVITIKEEQILIERNVLRMDGSEIKVIHSSNQLISREGALECFLQKVDSTNLWSKDPLLYYDLDFDCKGYLEGFRNGDYNALLVWGDRTSQLDDIFVCLFPDYNELLEE